MADKMLFDSISSEFKHLPKNAKVRGDWQIIWVLTGYKTSLAVGNPEAKSDTGRRLDAGIKLAKRVASLRAPKETPKLRIEKIKVNYPKIYISGYNSHNQKLKKLRSQDYFEKNYHFPKENIIIGPLEGIRHTGDQFEKFPKQFLRTFRKIIIVTDTYHIPRVKRYVRKFFKNDEKRFILYYPEPPVLGKRQVQYEIKKIIQYSKENIIPALLKGS